MERYINSFATENDIQIALENGELLKPYVAYIEDVDRIDWNSKEKVDYATEYLTFNILSAGTINWTASDSSVTKTIEYKLNNNEWASITSNTGSSAPTITVNSGDKLQFRGNNAQYTNSYSVYNSFSGSTASFEVEGNVMSLIYGDDFKNKLAISSGYALASLFRGCTKLVSAKNLILPATTLAENCYDDMFNNCKSLTTAPELPATTLASGCYNSMFVNCTSLTIAPALPAMTLAYSCYSVMFYGCTSLTTAPKLPATTLANNCYYGMFQGCTSLTTAPELPATTLANSCYYSMFKGCTSLTTAPELPATTLANGCYYQMFYDCTSLTVVPALPATVLAEECYRGMFWNCTGLTTVPSNLLPATTLKSDCYRDMFYVCKNLTTAPELPATTLTVLCYDSMFYGCTKLNYIKCLATDISALYCTSGWLSGVASTGTFVKASSMTSWTEGNSGIPTGWTVQDA